MPPTPIKVPASSRTGNLLANHVWTRPPSPACGAVSSYDTGTSPAATSASLASSASATSRGSSSHNVFPTRSSPGRPMIRAVSSLASRNRWSTVLQEHRRRRMRQHRVKRGAHLCQLLLQAARLGDILHRADGPPRPRRRIEFSAAASVDHTTAAIRQPDPVRLIQFDPTLAQPVKGRPHPPPIRPINTHERKLGIARLRGAHAKQAEVLRAAIATARRQLDRP